MADILKQNLISLFIIFNILFFDAFAIEYTYYDNHYGENPEILCEIDFSDMSSSDNADIVTDEYSNALKLKADKSINIISNVGLIGGVYKLSFENKLLSETNTYQYIQLYNDRDGFNTYRIYNNKLGFFRSKNTWTISDFCRTIPINKWISIDMMINLDKEKIDYYIDGEYLYGMSYPGLNKIDRIAFANEEKTAENVLFDNVVFEEVFGTTAEELEAADYKVDSYLKSNPIRMEISTNKTGNIFTGMDDTEFTLELYNRSSNAVPVNVSYTVTNQKTYEKSKTVNLTPVSLDALKVNTQQVKIDINKYGIYYIDFIMDVNGDIVTERAEFSVCKPINTDNSDVGVNVHLSRKNWFGNETVARIGNTADNLGVGYVRGNIIDSQQITKDNNGYYLSFTENSDDQSAYEAATVERDMKAIQILSYGYGEKGAPPVTEDELNNFYNYVYDFVSKYKGIIKCWEIWNEYNLPAANTSDAMNSKNYAEVAENYTNMLRTAYTAAKAADKDCTVIGMVAASAWTSSDRYRGISFVEDVLKLGGGNYMDVLSYHYYGVPIPTPEESGIINELAEIKRLMVKPEYNCADKELWLTETGFSAAGGRYAISPNDEVNYYTQAKFMITELAALKAHNVADKVMFYMIHDKDITTYRETGFGLTRSYSDVKLPFAAKPAYLALSNWNSLMNGAVQDKILSSDDGNKKIYSYKLPDGNDLLVMYTAGQGKYETKLKLDCNSGIVYDIYGNETAVAGNDNVFNFILSDEPIYFKGKINNPSIETEDEAVDSIVLYNEDFEKNYIGGYPDFWKVGSAENAYCIDGPFNSDALMLKKNIEKDYPLRTQINMRNYEISGDGVYNISIDFMIPSADVMSDIDYSVKLSDINNSNTYLFRISEGGLKFYEDMTDWNSGGSEMMKITAGTWYTVNAKINMQDKSAEVSVGDIKKTGAFTKNSFDRIYLIAENMGDNIKEAQFCIDNISVLKGTKAAGIKLLVNGKTMSSEYKIMGGDYITAYADITGTEIADRSRDNMRIILAVYRNDVLSEVKMSDMQNIASNNISITMDENISSEDIYRVSAFMWEDMIPIISACE